MKNSTFAVFVLLFIFPSCQEQPIKMSQTILKYPNTRREIVQDSFLSTTKGKLFVEDPYRWLEDPNSAETKTWIMAQNAITTSELAKIPFRKEVESRLETLWNYEKYTTPFKEGGKYYYFKNDGLQNQSVLFVQNELNGISSVVLDPNKFSAAGTTSLSTYSFSKDAKYLAFATSEGGSDWNTIQVLDLSTNTLTADKVNWVKFSGISWYKNGFFYSRYPAPKGEKLAQKNEFHQVWYHTLGSSQTEDKLIYEDAAHPLRNCNVGITEDERFLYLSVSESTSGNALFFKAANTETGGFQPIITHFENDNDIIDNQDGKLLCVTTLDAPNKRVVLIDTKNPTPENWTTIIPETEDVLQSVTVVGKKIFTNYLKNACTQIKIHTFAGAVENEVQLPGIGTAVGFDGKNKDTEIFYSFTSFTRPTTIYKYDIATNTSTIFKSSQIDFKPDDFETKQIFYPSKDGTKIPMFISYKKGLKLDGKNPVWLYGYGGFNISITPSFKIPMAYFMEQGGIYAVANLRGGGEYGEKWHKAGTLLQKQNVFDDFIAAAEYLIANKYTNKDKIAIEGRSNGGLLVGACMTQRPDLFKVALPGVGVLDMLRYHKFTIGWAWATDYGRSDEPEQVDNLLRYSPYHNCKSSRYPATMITTGDHDDRVVPAHSFKFAAALQNVNKSENPTLIRIDTKAGHGAGKSTKMTLQEEADKISFTMFHLGILKIR